MYKRICVSMVIRDENYDIIKFKKFNHETIEEIDGNEDVTIFDCCDKIDNLPNNIKRFKDFNYVSLIDYLCRLAIGPYPIYI